MIGHWPWWGGALALSSLALIFWVVERRLLGVSGKVTAAVEAVRRPGAERDAQAVANADFADLEAALIAATREEFGDVVDDEPEPASSPPSLPQGGPRAFHVPLTANLGFLLAVMLGGAAAAASHGGWSLDWTLGSTFDSLLGSGLSSWLLLLGGGVMVGFGTRMCGGCTTGHGICGAARFQSGSLSSTMAFFGTAVVFSFAMEWLLR
jgi:hypothetical protein